MRLLLVSDLHYSLPQYDWVVEHAHAYDIVVMCGDHLDIASLVDGRTQSIVVKKYFARLRDKTRLLICSGNHDLDAKTKEGEKVARWLQGTPLPEVLSDGQSFTFEDTLFTMCPWWDGPVTRAELGEQLAEAAAKRGTRWIWLYHAPPDKSPISWAGTRYFGDAELSQWIERFQPELVLCGHVHESPFVPNGSWVDRIGKTWVFNTGHEPGPIPPHIIIDTEAEEAVWFSSAVVQSVRLEETLQRPLPQLSALPEWLKAGDRPRAQAPR